jgi:HAD superfamily hydrolase (TIGR01509 family)
MDQSHTQRASSFDAVILDMDGVITDTAAVHASAWKKLFDEEWPRISDEQGAPFDADADYRRFIDGRLREEGIRTYLASRGIVLPETEPSRPGGATVASLAARKQIIFTELLTSSGVPTVPGTLEFLRWLRGSGVATAVVTSSRNCVPILAAAAVSDLLDVQIDGNDARSLQLAGKPAADLFLEAARRLRVAPERAVVVEDSVSGVEAAHNGGFGLIVGLNRAGFEDQLLAAGADLVLKDLRDLDLEAGRLRETPHQLGLEGGNEPWALRYDGFAPSAEGLREALCTLGNGYWGSRGAAPEADADSVHYPGTYLAGVYNRVRTDLGSHVVETEHIVNAPNWLPLWFAVADGDWFRPGNSEQIEYRQELDLRRAVLTRVVRVRDIEGRTTSVTTRRFISQAEQHVAVLETTFVAEDWSGALTVRAGLDGRVANRNVVADRLLTGTHLTPRATAAVDAETILLEVETTRSGVHIAMAARTSVFAGGTRIHPDRQLLRDDAGQIAHQFTIQMTPGIPVRVEKVVIVSTSRDRAILSPRGAVTTWMRRLADPEALRAAHEREWQVLWDEFHVRLQATGRTSLALNVNTFHLLQTLASVDVDLDAGVPARGLHGEGYQGHVFWDELFVYPILTLRRPDLSRALLGYRYRRLKEARAAAGAAGFDGAMFPWQSGIDGSDVTPRELLNPRTGEWMPDNSWLQRHVGLAIGYSVWQYYQSTGDVGFLIRQGAELLLEVARFFASLAAYDEASDRYDIAGVMGPDEFHDGYPGAAGTGVRNNAYTNIMAAWVLARAADCVSLVEQHHSPQLWNRLRLRPDEPARWAHISHRLRVPFLSDGVISQFEGYERLAELDWARYRSRYGATIGRLDLILAAEGDTTNNYRVSKQADVLMLLYLFSAEELRALLAGMGYALPPEAIVRTVEFYGSRSTHGSTLSNVVHSWLEARRDRERSWRFLSKALESDIADIQGGSTREGVHLGAMAGSVDMLVRCYTGLEFRDDKLWLHPVLPQELAEVAFGFNYREQPIRLELSATRLRLRLDGTTPVTVMVEGVEVTLSPGESHDFALGAQAPTAQSP